MKINSTNYLTINNNYNKSQSNIERTMQRLSSGLRINSAKDDAAGLAISQRLKTQINGNNIAVKNSNDGISLSQVAEGSLSTLTSILQRSRELAVQSANWTNSENDRKALESENDQLLKEFSRIISTENFNGKKIFDGSFAAEVFQVGANSGDNLTISLPSLSTEKIGAKETSPNLWTLDGAHRLINEVTATSGIFDGNKVIWDSSHLFINGNQVIKQENASAKLIAEEISAIDGVFASARTEFTLIPPLNDTSLKKIQIIINDDPARKATLTYTTANEAVSKINNEFKHLGIKAISFPEFSTGSFRIISESGENIGLINNSELSNIHIEIPTQRQNTYPITGRGRTLLKTTNEIDFTSEKSKRIFGTIETIISSNNLTFSMKNFEYNEDYNEVYSEGYYEFTPESKLIPLSSISLNTSKSSIKALNIIDSSLDTILSTRAKIGAIQSRFEYAANNIEIQSENLSASNSRIEDADFAIETATLSRYKILTDASSKMLSTNNNLNKELVLSLLK